MVMSKRIVASMVVVVLFLAALSQVVLAQQGPAGGPGPAMHEMMGKEITPEQFPEVKARVLKMIDERKTRLDKEKACVEAATNGAELKKCRPERPMGEGGGMQGGPGQQRPSRPGGEQKP
jgi:primosomal protein N''